MKAHYPIRAVLRFTGPLPRETRVIGSHVKGVLGTDLADVSRWKRPPHEVFANLPTRDFNTGQVTVKPVSGVVKAKVVEAFVKKYGLVSGSIGVGESFTEDVVYFADAQDILRRAWMGDIEAIREIEQQVADVLEAVAAVKPQGIELVTENLWSFICVLFLLDHAAGKTGVCGNPDCFTPYFIHKRTDQKYCGRQECSSYAQNRYALGWWERKGYKLRADRSKAKSAERR